MSNGRTVGLLQLMVKLATSLQHQVRYEYNRSTEVRPTIPHNLASPTMPPPPGVPSASYIQHLTVAWDTMHTQVGVLYVYVVLRNWGPQQQQQLP